jgi:hypothetical protein
MLSYITYSRKELSDHITRIERVIDKKNKRKRPVIPGKYGTVT